MKTYLLSISLLFAIITGCNVSPFSPKLNQKINNQDGQIEDIKNNQNGIMFEIGKIRQQNEINARDIENAQQGLINLRGSNNSGVQILSGDGGLLIVCFFSTLAIVIIFHYRQRATKSEKSAEILAQQIALYDDSDLDDKVFLSALNSPVESDIYHLMVKSQAITGKTRKH